jgi:hypothetical protein
VLKIVQTIKTARRAHHGTRPDNAYHLSRGYRHELQAPGSRSPEAVVGTFRVLTYQMK